MVWRINCPSDKICFSYWSEFDWLINYVAQYNRAITGMWPKKKCKEKSILRRTKQSINNFFFFLLFFVFVSSWSQNLTMQSCNVFFSFWISNHDHASLVIQKVKNLSIMQETQVPSRGREVPLEKEMATHSRILAWESHGQRTLAGNSLWGCKELNTTERLTFSLSHT